MQNQLKQILFDEATLQQRVRGLAAEVESAYQGQPLTALILSNGALFFAADLLRRINLPLHLDMIGVSSYSGTDSRGQVDFRYPPKLPLHKHHVLIVDDILDTGRTLEGVIAFCRDAGALSVRCCVLLDKPSRRIAPIQADFIGFSIDDLFVVGYGLDLNEKFRNLPCIGIPDLG